MARSDGTDRHPPEPLSRLLERSEAVSRELERARDHLAELQERFDAEEPLTSDPAAAPAAPAPAEPAPGEPAPAEPAPAEPAMPAQSEPPAEPESSAADPNRGWVVRLPVASEPHAELDLDDDADVGPEADEPSLDAGITMLQEAARRRLSDER
jgi:hypothetical protein